MFEIEPKNLTEGTDLFMEKKLQKTRDTKYYSKCSIFIYLSKYLEMTFKWSTCILECSHA